MGNGLIEKLVDEHFEEFINIRRHLHKNPELSGNEYNTAAFIQTKLKECNVKTQSIAKTGVVGLLEGMNPDSKCVAIRADIDALPVEEQTATEYQSQNKGIMHACGHDVHSTCALGAAIILSKLSKSFNGTVKFLFQPSEEVFPGGALDMIMEGAMKNPVPDAIFATHVDPKTYAGQIAIKKGIYSSAVDEILISIIGKGCHGAYPHQGVDPILISAHIMVALQQLVTRNANIEEPCVLTFGYIKGDGEKNVIPSVCDIKGTLRTRSEAWRNDAHDRIIKMVNGIAEAMGAKAKIDIIKGYPPMFNDIDLTEMSISALNNAFGKNAVVSDSCKMGGEDFSYFQKEVPGCMFSLGVRNEAKGIIYPLHSPKFDIDEECIKMGIIAMITVVLTALERFPTKP